MKAKSLPIFLRYFLPLAALILVAAYFYAESRRSAERNQVESSERLSVKLGAGMLERRLLSVILDLRTLAGDSAIHSLEESASAEERQRTASDFLNFLRARRAYDQIRLINRSGHEVIRVDTDQGQPRIVGRDQLQDKSDRYYFQESMKLAPGDLYISPFDLNVEAGQIEVPYKPTLRVATPIADDQDKSQGILILNYRGDEMIRYVAEVTEPAADHLMVVNGDGYFLHSPQPAEQWGFMFQRPDLSLAQRYPESWARLKALDKGQFEDRDGLWTVATVYPRRVGQPLANWPTASEDNYRWQVVTHLPPAALPGLVGHFDASAAAFVVVLLGLAALLAYYQVRNFHHKQRMETRFRAYFDSAMVGMAVTDVARRWQIVNPALCTMLGYSAEELVGKTWREVTYPEDLPASDKAYAKVLNGEMDGYKMDKRYIRADGKIINAYVAVQVVRTARGEVDSLIGIFEDITTRVAAQNALRASEESLRRLGDNLPDSYVYQYGRGKDNVFRFTYISDGVRQVHGCEPEAVMADPGLLMQDLDPAYLPGLNQAIVDSERDMSDFSQELRVHLADGRWGWLQLRSRPRRLEDGTIQWDGVATDITARREAATLIQLQAQRAEALLQLPLTGSQLDEAAFMRHVLGQIKRLTDSQMAFIHLTDASGRETSDCSLTTFDGCSAACTAGGCPFDRTPLQAEVIRRRGPLIDNDYAPPGGSGADCPVLVRLAGVPVIEDAQICLIVGVGNKSAPYSDTDIETIQLLANASWRIVHQRRAEQALRIAMQVVNASPVVCFRWRASPGWPVVFVSDNVANWGYNVDGLLAGQPPFADLVHPDDLERVAEEVERYTAEGRTDYVQEYRLVKADGEVIWVTDRTRILRTPTGEVEFYDGVLTDITERRQGAQELTETLAAQRQLNKRLEEAHNQLLQSEKMASIGQLAAGIAHELNNPIGFVHSNLGTLEGYLRDIMDIIDAYAETLTSETDPALKQKKLEHLREERDFSFIREDIGQLLNESKDGLVRVRKIVQDLKSFSHVSEQDWQWADLHQGLDSTLNIVWNELKYKCQVVKEYGELPKVYCLISQLNQVFMNLLVNASHAIETKGTITIRTALLGADAVCIEISDTGKGIAPEHLSRIFEPFFTTKPIGKGTGLGLSLSYGIVDRHHGRIEVDSQVGVGSTFRVILPITQDAAPAASTLPEATP